MRVNFPENEASLSRENHRACWMGLDPRHHEINPARIGINAGKIGPNPGRTEIAPGRIGINPSKIGVKGSENDPIQADTHVA